VAIDLSSRQPRPLTWILLISSCLFLLSVGVFVAGLAYAVTDVPPSGGPPQATPTVDILTAGAALVGALTGLVSATTGLLVAIANLRGAKRRSLDGKSETSREGQLATETAPNQEASPGVAGHDQYGPDEAHR
jgi:hypothetical protein